MTDEADKITVQIKHKETEQVFSGNVEQVWLSLNKFFSEFLPCFETASRLTLKIDLQKIARDSEGIIAFSNEGSNLLVPRDKLTDNETLELWLLANYIGSRLGIVKSESLSKEELQTKLGKNPKIASTRLGELVKDGTLSKTADEQYKITTFGVVQAQKEMLPKIRAKMGT